MKPFYLCLTALPFLLYLLVPTKINAASLSVIESSDNYVVGEQSAVDVHLDLEGGEQALGVEVYLSFDIDQLEVIDIIPAADVADVWNQSIEFIDNKAGVLSFSITSPNVPLESALTTASILFEPKSAGEVSFTFSEDSESTVVDYSSGSNILALTFSPLFTVDPANCTHSLCDYNGDEIVDILDVIMLIREIFK